MRSTLALAALSVLALAVSAQSRTASPLPAADRAAGASGRAHVRAVPLPFALSPGGTLPGDGEHLTFLAYEEGQGVDLNGDGDLLDAVAHVLSPGTRSPRNSGLAGGLTPLAKSGHTFLGVRELNQGGIDLNDDGDLFDRVLHAIRGSDGTALSTELAASVLDVDGDLVALQVSESSQGGVDQNGNGSVTDSILHLWNLKTGELLDLGFDTNQHAQVRIHSPYVLFLVREQAEGDKNGDGDAFDYVLHVYDADQRVLTNTRCAIAYWLDAIRASGSSSAYLVWEGGQGMDLNGDEDLEDAVLHVYDASTNETRNVGVGVEPVCFFVGHGGSNCSTPLWKGDRFLAFQSDVGAGQLHVYDYDTGQVRNLGSTSFAHELGDELLAFSTLEGPGTDDLNSDGDRRDEVVQVVDLVTGVVANTGLATLDAVSASPLSIGPAFFSVSGRRVAVAVSEQAQGATDLNGDGDTADYVPALFFYDQGEVEQLGVACYPPQLMLTRSHFAFVVPELNENGMDLNADGDSLDAVVHVRSVFGGLVVNTGVTVAVGRRPARAGVWWGLRVDEDSVGTGIDWNGDGDTLDRVPLLLNVRR